MKRTLCTLCAVAVLFCTSIPAAFAASSEAVQGGTTSSTDEMSSLYLPEPAPVVLYPTEVREREENGTFRIEKVYHLNPLDDPADIPTADFEREGRHYTLLDVVKNTQVEEDVQDYGEVFTLESDTKDMEKILPMLEPELEVATEEGYMGLLSLDHTTITVEAAGYRTSSRTVSATRTYPNLSGADVSLIPKSVEEGGRTLTLADVQWQEAASAQADGYDMALRYTATATYTGTATSQYATGYVVTAQYRGQIRKVNTDQIIYTAIFSSQKPAASPLVAQNEGSGFSWWLLLVPMGVAVVGAAAYFGHKKYQHYINRKRGYE